MDSEEAARDIPEHKIYERNVSRGRSRPAVRHSWCETKEEKLELMFN